MYTLDNFYKSKQWQKLLEVIKLDRTNEDGQIICWHCKKPIVNKYDCIGHHTIFLTEDNVNNLLTLSLYSWFIIGVITLYTIS